MYQSNVGMRQRRNRAISWLVIAAMAAVCLFPMTVLAEAGAPDATIKISYQKDAKGFVLARQTKTVASNLSEQYGYVDAYNGTKVTALDAVVAAHIAVFGVAKATISSKLTVGSGGFLTNCMGDGAGNFFFYVNGETLNISVGEKLIANGDIVELHAVLDTSNWSDVYAKFLIGGKNVAKITIKPGDAVNLAVNSVTWNGDESVVSGAAIVPVTVKGDAGTFGAKQAVTDSAGKAVVTFNKAGTYILSAVSGDATPIVSPWLEVTVQSKDAKLKKIKVSTGTLSPKFKASKVSYKLKLKAKKSSVKLTPLTSDKKAKLQIKVGSGKYKKVKNAKVTLKKGKSKTVKIKVIAESGQTKIYTVKVTRAKK